MITLLTQETEIIQNIEEESESKEIDKITDEVPENKAEVSQSTENKDTYNDYLNSLIDAKKNDCENAYQVGRILKTAKTSLVPKEYYKLLNDKRIKYRRTQAEKYINFADRVDNCHTCDKDDIKSLGVEKNYRLSKLDKENQHQTELDNFAINNPDISVRQLEKIVKKMNENSELTPEQAWEKVQDEQKTLTKNERKSVPLEEYNKLKENTVSLEKYNELQKSYDDLKDKYEKIIEEQNRNKLQNPTIKTDYLKQDSVSLTSNQDSFTEGAVLPV